MNKVTEINCMCSYGWCQSQTYNTQTALRESKSLYKKDFPLKNTATLPT